MRRRAASVSRACACKTPARLLRLRAISGWLAGAGFIDLKGAFVQRLGSRELPLGVIESRQIAEAQSDVGMIEGQPLLVQLQRALGQRDSLARLAGAVASIARMFSSAGSSDWACAEAAYS
jgi:hypothetical protein